MKISIIIVLAAAVVASAYYASRSFHNKSDATPMSKEIVSGNAKTAVFAGGCFWCVEADFEKLTGIVDVVSGYSGGKNENPTYENYAEGGHREVVEVTYDPAKTTYKDLVEHILLYSDPTDASGSFYDRGKQYAPAIYYETDEEKNIAEEAIRRIDALGVYDKPIVIDVLPRTEFWLAEGYHQNYAKKNPIRYSFYRGQSGRDTFIGKHKEKLMSKEPFHFIHITKDTSGNATFEGYRKPADATLKEELSPLEYDVTQKEGTEPPFTNEYDANKADGIYVDRISGEPLFSSRDKFDSGTGWPSFVKPLEPDDIVLREDNTLFAKRTEVRSRHADSHLGHVFDDGPRDRGGKRYCMNSAALLFIPKEEMQEKGYGKYLHVFE